MSDALIIQHVRPEPPGTIAAVLEAEGLSVRTVQVFRGDPVPDTLDASRLVVMGGPMGVADLDERPHLVRECALVEEALREECPVLGVCLGSQLLAHVLGADVRPGPTQEIGWGHVHRTAAGANDPLFGPVKTPFRAFHWHGDVFTMPRGAVRLARTPQTEHQAFRYGASAYGLLFHLEVTPKIVAWMTTAFQDELDAEGIDGAALRRAAVAHESALRSTARQVFGAWAGLDP